MSVRLERYTRELQAIPAADLAPAVAYAVLHNLDPLAVAETRVWADADALYAAVARTYQIRQMLRGQS